LFITTTTAELSFYSFRTEEGISLNDNSEFDQTDATKINEEDGFVNPYRINVENRASS